jgi:hypothetical protein
LRSERLFDMPKGLGFAAEQARRTAASHVSGHAATRRDYAKPCTIATPCTPFGQRRHGEQSRSISCRVTFRARAAAKGATEYFISGEAAAIAHLRARLCKASVIRHFPVAVRHPPQPSTQLLPSHPVSSQLLVIGTAKLPVEPTHHLINWKLEPVTHAVRRAIWRSNRGCCYKYTSSPPHYWIATLALASTTVQQPRRHPNSCIHAAERDKSSRLCLSSMIRTNLRRRKPAYRKPFSSSLKEMITLEVPLEECCRTLSSLKTQQIKLPLLRSTPLPPTAASRCPSSIE